MQKTHQRLQTDAWHDQMVILYYEIHSLRIIDVPLPSTGSWLPSRLTSTWRCIERIFSNSKYA